MSSQITEHQANPEPSVKLLFVSLDIIPKSLEHWAATSIFIFQTFLELPVPMDLWH